jgi:hypothetical protein
MRSPFFALAFAMLLVSPTAASSEEPSDTVVEPLPEEATGDAFVPPADKEQRVLAPAGTVQSSATPAIGVPLARDVGVEASPGGVSQIERDTPGGATVKAKRYTCKDGDVTTCVEVE